jgi:transcription elongation GreA/GreB family factor
VSSETRRRLEEELAVLRDQRAALGTEPGGQAPGDRADDAETLRRLDDAAMLDDRITEITRILAAGTRIPTGGVPDHGLPDGTLVTLRHGDGTVEVLRAVAFTEEVPPGQEDSSLTLDSPLGRAIAGHGPGETVTYQTPEGARRAEIVQIRPPV